MADILVVPMMAFALAASISPGPVNLVCLSSGTRYSLPKGLVFATGATLGFISLFLAIGLGLYSFLSVFSGFKQLLSWAGILFLLYLSLRLFLDSGELGIDEAPEAPSFMTGAAMQWLNPKAWLASVSGISAYTNSENLIELVIFASLYMPICWLSLGCWVYAGATLRRYTRQPKVIVALNRTLSILIAASCVFIVMD